jgi:nitrous oxide reductase accessory protein NosL
MNKTRISGMVFIFLLCSGIAFADTDIQQSPSCKYCGMDRAKFAHTRMLVTYDDGTSAGTCSIHCLAIEMIVNMDKTPKTIQVGDYNSKNLIDAEKASWVVGGKMPGVMTTRAKWAFQNKADAEHFIAEHGGSLATFDEAMQATFADMYADTRMIREKRKMMKK